MATFKPPEMVKSTLNPQAFIVPPTLSHKQIFVILHGRGSNARTFGPPLLSTELSNDRTFQAAFPHAQFIFPTASKHRAQVYNRSIIHQWFDNGSLSNPAEKEWLMINGLRETSG